MRKCPFSYAWVEGRYAPRALRVLHPKLSDLADLPYSAQDLREESAQRAHKLSIGGVQPKLSAVLNLKEQRFELVDQFGRFILKPQTATFRHVPESEDCTMKLAATVGLEVPPHGLVYGSDGALTYWIQRFDRVGKTKLAVEDFAQLLGSSRDHKYRSSLEQVAGVVERHCTFPRVEAVKLLRLVLFCFLCGNEDQHLKNFSLLTDAKGVTQLTPCYDLVNTSIVLRNPQEESALTIAGRRRKLKLSDFVAYAETRLRLTPAILAGIFRGLAQGLPRWSSLVRSSFLPDTSQDDYLRMVGERATRLGLLMTQLEPGPSELLTQALEQTGARVHRAFFSELEKQHFQDRLCLLPEQIALARERAEESSDLQETYRLITELAASPPASSPL